MEFYNTKSRPQPSKKWKQSNDVHIWHSIVVEYTELALRRRDTQEVHAKITQITQFPAMCNIWFGSRRPHRPTVMRLYNVIPFYQLFVMKPTRHAHGLHINIILYYTNRNMNRNMYLRTNGRFDNLFSAVWILLVAERFKALVQIG